MPEEPAASYLTLERGTPVVDCFGEPVGRVKRVLAVAAPPMFDGLIVATHAGRRFIDAPEVKRIHADRVELTITRADCEVPGLTSRAGVPAARWGRTEITEADRREAIEALKRAYVDDVLTADELGDRFESVYTAETLAELRALIPD